MGEKRLREREDEEKERAEKLGEREKGSDRERERSKRVRKGAPRNRGSERDRVTERGNVQRETKERRWKRGFKQMVTLKSKPG